MNQCVELQLSNLYYSCPLSTQTPVIAQQTNLVLRAWLEIMKLFNIVCMLGVYRYKCGNITCVTVTFFMSLLRSDHIFDCICSKID